MCPDWIHYPSPPSWVWPTFSVILRHLRAQVSIFMPSVNAIYGSKKNIEVLEAVERHFYTHQKHAEFVKIALGPTPRLCDLTNLERSHFQELPQKVPRLALET